MIGGTGGSAGYIRSLTSMGDVTIGGDLRGANTSGNGFGGAILTPGSMGKLKIGGDVIGGPDVGCGTVDAGSIKSVSVGGSLKGNYGLRSGSISALSGSIGAVTIGGDVIGGVGDSSGSVRAADGNIGSVTLRGDLKGGNGPQAGSIMASSPAGTHGTLGVVKIGGDVSGNFSDYFGRRLRPQHHRRRNRRRLALWADPGRRRAASTRAPGSER